MPAEDAAVFVPAHQVLLTGEAAAALREWTPFVDGMADWAGRDEHRAPIRGLIDWYVEVWSDEEWSEPPPMDGLDALADELSATTQGDRFARLGLARWAVRVAEELVRLRAAVGRRAAPATVLVAGSRLELALGAAGRRLADAGATH